MYGESAVGVARINRSREATKVFLGLLVSLLLLTTQDDGVSIKKKKKEKKKTNFPKMQCSFYIVKDKIKQYFSILLS